MNDKGLLFYIPHICTDDESVTLLNYCIQSIQKFYPESEIIVCESPSTFIPSVNYDCKNYTHIANPIPNSMTLGCIKHYLEKYQN